MIDEGQIELASGTFAVVAPTREGSVLVGFYARGIPGPGRMTADEWAAFKAMVDRALGREVKARRPIAREDESHVAEIVAREYGGKLSLGWDANGLRMIGGVTSMGAERVGLAAILQHGGIFPGALYWEIEA